MELFLAGTSKSLAYLHELTGNGLFINIPFVKLNSESSAKKPDGDHSEWLIYLFT